MAISVSQFSRLLLLNSDLAKPRPNVPYLIWEAPLEASASPSHWERTDGGAASLRPRAGEALILSVEKAKKANPFAMGITVGRGDTNDLVIDDASISRFHAFFQFDERKSQWSLTDAESRNGTMVHGKRMPAKSKIDLIVPSNLRFGNTRITFCDHAYLLIYLAKLTK